MALTPNFKRSEFACKCGCGFDAVDFELLTTLELIRFNFKKPVVINSGCRCASHNNTIGGSPNSHHMLGKAADIKIKDVSPKEVYDAIDMLYPHKYGIGLYDSWVHIDVREKRARW